MGWFKAIVGVALRVIDPAFRFTAANLATVLEAIIAVVVVILSFFGGLWVSIVVALLLCVIIKQRHAERLTAREPFREDQR